MLAFIIRERLPTFLFTVRDNQHQTDDVSKDDGTGDGSGDGDDDDDDDDSGERPF